MKLGLVLTAITGTLLVKNFSEFHKYAEQLLGRAIWTREFPHIEDELKAKALEQYGGIEKLIKDLDEESINKSVFDWLKRWVDAYEENNKDGKAKDFLNWVFQQPMQAG